MKESRVVLRGVQGLIGGGLAGAVVGGMTVGLNQHLSPPDVLVLLLWLALPPAVSVGTAVVLFSLAGRKLRSFLFRSGDGSGPSRLAHDARSDWVASVLVAGPTGAALALPDLGLSGEVVSNAVLGMQAVDLLVFGVLLLGFVGVGALTARVVLRRVTKGGTAGRATVRRRWSWVLLLAAFITIPWLGAARVASIADRPSSAARAALTPTSQEVDAGDGPQRPERVVVLNIDGLDPAVIDQLGPQELPFLWSFREVGVSGPLATEVPTLSPAIWTTMVTGTSRRVHGIRGFLYFQLPGMRKPVWEFPLHSGLNFTLIPWLERALGASDLAVPYRSTHRLVPALWEILEGAASIGVYRWRATWPVEQTATAMAAEHVNQQLEEFARVQRPLSSDWVWPSDLLDGITMPERGDGVDLVRRLVELITKYDLDLMVAALSSVDGVQHQFGLQWAEAGEGRERIVSRYRQQDRRLSALYEALGSETDMIVISDHGFSFEHGHHAQAPPGVFLARGPSFRRGLVTDVMSIYDLAPLVIDLFGVPLSRELPGAARLSHRSVLRSPGQLRTVDRYRPRSNDGSRELPEEDTEALKERLRALGYIR